MNGKKPSWLLRAGSFLLAALMVFGNLYLPSGFLKASAAETVLFSTDFENDSLGSISMDTAMNSGDRGWHSSYALSDNVSFGVTEVNGNKVLAVTKADATTTNTFDIKFDLQDGNNPDPSITYAELSYNIALTANMQFFFPAICNSHGYTRSAYFGSNGGSMVYQPGSGWTNMFSDGAKLVPNKWYTVKQIYKLPEGENAAVVEVWIDGVKTLTTANGSPADISGFVMQLFKSSAAGTVYLDNINFTTAEHEPAKNPVPCVSQFYSENFDNAVVGAPSGAWYGDTDSFQFAENAVNGNNKALMINKTTTDANKMLKAKPLTYAVGQAVLEYSVYYTDGAGTVYALTPMSSNIDSVVPLVLQSNGELQYQVSGKNYKLAQLNKNEKNTIKLAVDAENSAWYIWVNGEYIVPSAGNATTQSDIQGLMIRTVKDATATGFYFDDIKLTPYIPAKELKLISAATVILEKGESVDLSYSFSPAVASVQEVTVTSSNAAVAAVENGKIVAKDAGTATINLDPVQEGLESKTVTVTVTAPVVNQVLYQTGFESTDAENFSEGSFGADPSTKKTSYTNWTLNAAYDGQLGNISIKKIGDNQVLSITNKCGGTSGVQNCTIPLLRNGLGDANEVWVSYNVAVMSAQTAAYFPTPGAGSGRCAMFGTNNNQGFQWQPANNSWQPIQYAQAYEAEGIKAGDTVAFTPKTWYTVEFHYANTVANGGEAATVEVYIDGKLTDVGIWTSYDNSKTVAHLMMELNKWGKGDTEMLIDDIQVSTMRHTPATKPAPLVEETEEAESYYTEDFEGVALTDGIGKSPLGFGSVNVEANKEVGFRVKEVTGKDGQTTKALEVFYTNDALYKTENEGTENEKKSYDSYSQLVNVQGANDAQAVKAVLEYDVYSGEGAATMYPLSLRSNYDFGVKLVLEGNGKLRTNTNSETIKQLSKNEWHHIKIVGDGATDKWYIWVDGEYIPVKNNNTNGNVSGFRGVYMTTYHNNDAAKPSNIFFDNIKYYEYTAAESMTVAQTSYELTAGQTAQLNVTFAGENVSAPVAIYTSASDAVATVDATGKITAVGAGETTITVTAAGDATLTQTVTVKVNAAPVVNTTYLDTGFEANETVPYVPGTKITQASAYNGWKIKSWGGAITSDAQGLVSIKTINGNQVLSLMNLCELSETGSRLDRKIRVGYDLGDVGSDVWVTFNAGIMKAGTAAFFPAPVLAGGAEAAYYGINDGVFQYQDGLWDDTLAATDSRYKQWDAITLSGTTTAPAKPAAQTWYAIKLHYVNAAEGGYVELWIDGQKMNNITYGTKSGVMNGLIMELNHWGSVGECELLIDNVKVTNFDHTPATPSAGLEPPVVLNTGFETTDGYTSNHVLVEGTAYNGWNVDYATAGTGNAIIKEIKNTDGTKNQVLAVSTTARTGSGNTDVVVYYNLPKSLNYAVLTYNAATVSDGVLFYPSLGNGGTYAARFGSQTGLMTYWVKEIRAAVSESAREFGDPMKDLATTPANIPHELMKWHKVKLVYERDTSTGYFTTTVWIDGIKTNVINYNQETPSTDQVNRILLTASKFGSGTMYIDNICLTTDGSNPELPDLGTVPLDPIDYEEDFSDWELGDVTGFNITGYGATPGWSSADPEKIGTSIRVLDMNGNKVFAVTRYDLLGEPHPIRYNFLDRELKQATLTYNVAVSTHGMQAGFPSLTNRPDGTGVGANRLAVFGTNNGKFMYAPHGGGWFDAFNKPATFVPYTWYNVKQTYSIDDQGTVTTEVYINGELTNVSRAFDTTPNIASFLMMLNISGAAGTMFIDNIHLTEGDLANEPVANDQLPALIDFFEDFESIELDENGVGQWNGALEGGYRVVEGNSLEIFHENSSNVYTATAMTFAQPQTQTVIEYTLKYMNGSYTANLLTAAAAGTSPIKLALNTATGEISAEDGTVLATIDPTKTYNIKLVVDTATDAMYVWIDGVYVGKIAVTADAIASVSMQTVAGSACQGVYLDNIAIKDYVPVTDFSVKADGVDNALVYKTYPIIVTLNPGYASVDAYSFSIVSGADVVDVDVYGNIYAKTLGTARIKVAHPSAGDQYIDVNVTGVYEAAPILEETFDGYADGANNAATISGSGVGHYATVFNKNGNNVLQVSNPDGNNHAFAYIPFNKEFSGKVYLSYYLAVNVTDGHFYMPNLGNPASLGAVISVHGDGFFKYSTNGNDWTTLKYTDAEGGQAGYEKMKWYLIQVEYTGGANPDMKMWINKRPVAIEHYGRSSVSAFTMHMTKWMGSQGKDAYIDNIRITETPHDPMDAPTASLQVAATGVKILDEQGNVIDTTSTPYVINARTPVRLNVQTIPGGATDRSYTISSDNRTVADVDTNGNLVGYENGYANITVTLNSNKNISSTIRVQVVSTPVQSITISGEANALYVGGHCFATAVVTPANPSYSTIRWVAKTTDGRDASHIVKVDSYGEIVAVGEGTAVIYAYSEYDAVVSNEITVTVTEPEEEIISVSSVSTLRDALDTIAQINSSTGMTKNIVIELAGGYYYLDSTLKFGPEHSGTNGYSLVVRAKSGETPIISGAYEVSRTWAIHDADKNIYAVTLPEGIESRQMFVNNVRAIRARSTGGLTGSDFLYNNDGVNIGYTCYNTEFLSYARPDDLELVFKEQWTQPRIGVAQIRTGSKINSVELVLDQPGWSGGSGNGSSVTNKGGTSAQADGPVWFENAYELLDEPGEWYLDTVTNTLYYIPRPWENMNDVTVTLPVFDNSVEEDGKYPLPAGDGALVHISGTFNDTAKNDVNTQVQNIHFEGITFADTTWMRPSSTHGHSDAQNNHIRENGDNMAPGAVVVEAANAIWFSGCTFTRLGINGLQLQNGAQNSFVIGNHFYDISGNAITVGEPGTNIENAYAQGLNTVKNNDILNNYIHNIGVDFGSSAAISVGFAADMDMNHNEIFDVPYSGWHIGYGWNNRFPNNNKNMLLEYNFVHDIMDQGIFDGGAFYFLGNMSGEGYNDGYSFLRRNYIRKQMNAHGGIYPDQGTTYLKIVENVVDLSEVESWHSGAPKWSHTNQVCLHIHYENNFTTTDYHTYSNLLDFAKDDIVGIGPNPTGITVVPDANWTDSVALDVVANAGLQSSYTNLRNNQVERVKINVEDDVLLKKDATFTLDVTATDGRDNLISSGYAVYYASLNPEIATVSASGEIKGISSGLATVRVYVVSNGVLDEIDVSVVVEDVPEGIVIKGISNDITMSKTAIKTLSTKVITALGREIEPDSVTFGVVNKAIADVEDGVLKPVTTGVTSLVVTATAEGVTVTETFRVEIVEEMTYETVDVSDMFAEENEMYWYQNGTKDWLLTDGTSVKSVVGKSDGAGFANYTGNYFENQLMSFKLKIANPGGWPSIVLRAQDNSGYVSQGPDGYIFCMGKGGVELYRFVDGVRYVIYGGMNTGWVHVNNGAPALKPTESGFTYNGEGIAEHDIKVGAITDGDYVRILLFIDGVKRIDFLDKELAVVEPGCFGVIGKGETFTISKVSGITAPETPAAEVNGTTYPTLQAAINAAQPGQTVKVLENAVADNVVLDNITLDLNGKKLDVEYLIAFDADVIDSTGGSAVLNTKNVSLPKNNKHMPVWDEDAAGYRFFELISYQYIKNQTDNMLEFRTEPALGGFANDPFMAQSDTNGLSVKARLTWMSATGNEMEQNFTLKTEDVKSVYTSNNLEIALTVTGIANYKNNLKVTTYIVSETGVVWMPDGEVFVGQ